MLATLFRTLICGSLDVGAGPIGIYSVLVGTLGGGVAVEMQLSVNGFDAETAGDLWRWLTDVDELRGRVRLVDRPLPASQATGQVMGPTLTDTVAVGLGAGGAISVLAQALVVWLRRPRGLSIRLKITRPDGSTAEVEVDRADDTAKVEALVRLALGISSPTD